MTIIRVDCMYPGEFRIVKTDWISVTEAAEHINRCRNLHNMKQESKPEEMRRWDLYLKIDTLNGEQPLLIARNLSSSQAGQLGHFHNWLCGGYRGNAFLYTQELTNNVLTN